MSGVLKNRKKKEDAEALSKSLQQDVAFTSPVYPNDYESTKKSNKEAAAAQEKASEAPQESDSSDDDPLKAAKKKTKGASKSKAGGDASAGRKRKRNTEEDEEAGEGGEGEGAAKKKGSEASSSNKNAELKISEKGTIEAEDDDLSSDDEEVPPMAAGIEEGGEGGEHQTRQKKFIKRRLKRYLALEDKIAVFQRIVHDIDPKTKKLRYGASNEICADYSIGRKTINNIKNLFEGLIREGKDLSSLLTPETIAEIPSKLNVGPLVDENGNPIAAGEKDGADNDEQEKYKKLQAVKQSLGISGEANLASLNDEDDSSNDEAGGDNSGSQKYKPLFDDETRMRKMLKVNNVGRQTKLNDLTIERIRTIVPFCFGVKELSDMYEKEFGEKIHQSTLWRYCSELNIKIPKKTAKK